MARLINTNETPEEAEARRRASTARRIKILVFLSVGCIAARVVLHDPQRKAPIDYTKVRQVRIVPGMLDTMPAASRAALDPQVVTKMVVADEMASRGEYGKEPVPAYPKGTYKVADAPLPADTEAANYNDQVFAYARARRIEAARQLRDEAPHDTSQSTLVRFRSGGYLLAESADQRPKQTSIRVSRAMEAGVPSHWVSSVQKNAANWQEPVPSGQVRLKPARGITITLHREAASRITVQQPAKIDEI